MVGFLRLFALRWVVPSAIICAVVAVVLNWTFTRWALMSIGISVATFLIAAIVSSTLLTFGDRFKK